MKLKIGHLYPDVLNLYGDSGNIRCLQQRLKWRGIESEVTRLSIGENAKLNEYDLIFIGGGQDFEQEVLLSDLRTGKAAEIRAAVEDEVCFLTICGGYQMLGQYYETYDGVRCDFIGALDLWTIGSKQRMIGNTVFRCSESAGGTLLVGFENHSGKTWLGSGLSPLASVVVGFGNNGEDKTEGVRYKNVFGSYSHGPLLPKNPDFCDYLLKTALERRYGKAELMPLDDSAERLAHDSMIAQICRKAGIRP
ncbi:MAG: glutamine amidotransferase [Oscillospiraceae bacterium]|nr:glutamine amidotransferase [Oscillospiraceae bacterium]